MKIYSTKFYITQTMFYIASCRPSLIHVPHIINLEHAHTTTARKTNAFNRLQFYHPYVILSSLLTVFNARMFYCLTIAFWQLSNTRICYVMLTSAQRACILPYNQPCWFQLDGNCDQPTSTTTNVVYDIAYSSANAPSSTRTTVENGQKFSAVRRMSRSFSTGRKTQF